MNSLPSIAAAIKGSHTVFLVTNFWETAKVEVELAQGHNIADAAKEAGVSHLIFSSLIDVNKTTNGRLKHVTHFDGVMNEQYQNFLPPIMGLELLENHLLIEEPGYYAGESLKESLDAVPEKLVTLKEFVAKTKAFHE